LFTSEGHRKKMWWPDRGTEMTEKNQEIVSQDSRCPVRDSKWALPECDFGALRLGQPATCIIIIIIVIIINPSSLIGLQSYLILRNPKLFKME
jgi:hypothetical protein